MPQLVKAKAIAERTGMSVREVRDLVGKRVIPYVSLSARRIRFDVEAVDRWIASRTFNPCPTQPLR